MSQIIINGKSYTGSSISINNNRIIINGNQINEDSKVINITIDGNIDSLDVDYCEKVVVNGFVNKLSTTSGDVECGNVNQTVKTVSGDIECGNVGGDVSSTSGDIKAQNINGSVKTLSGDIKYVKDRGFKGE